MNVIEKQQQNWDENFKIKKIWRWNLFYFCIFLFLLFTSNILRPTQRPLAAHTLKNTVLDHQPKFLIRQVMTRLKGNFSKLKKKMPVHLYLSLNKHRTYLLWNTMVVVWWLEDISASGQRSFAVLERTVNSVLYQKILKSIVQP